MASTDFKTEFAVSMHCDACVTDIRNILKQQDGVQSYDIDLAEQRVIVEGRAAPSLISRALKESGRQVIVRGAGLASGTHAGAAICIFESYTPPSSALFDPKAPTMQVHGMARMVQTSEKDDGVCVVDLTIRHDALAREATAKGINTLQALVNGHEDKKVFPPSSSASADGAQRLTEDDLKRFTVYVAKSGDISEGAKSAGGIQRTLGEVEVNPRTGYGDLFIEIPRLKVWEMIGHAMVIAPLLTDPSQKNGAPKVGEGILAGVIARSAGAWGNDKTVCSCSGQSMWEENRLNIQGRL